MFGFLELLGLLLGAVVLPVAILLAPSSKAQALLLAVELPLVVWGTWLVATYQR